MSRLGKRYVCPAAELNKKEAILSNRCIPTPQGASRNCNSNSGAEHVGATTSCCDKVGVSPYKPTPSHRPRMVYHVCCSDPDLPRQLEVTGWQTPGIGNTGGDLPSSQSTPKPRQDHQHGSAGDRGKSVSRGKGKGQKRGKKTPARPQSSHVGEKAIVDDCAVVDTLVLPVARNGDARNNTATSRPSVTDGRRKSAAGRATAGAEAGKGRAGRGRKSSTPRDTKLPPTEGESYQEATVSSSMTTAAPAEPKGLTYTAMIPFLRNEGWKCADGKGFHTWFYVFPAKEGSDSRKRIDYLVSEKEVIKYVLGDEQIFARYVAFGDGTAPRSAGVAGRPPSDGPTVAAAAERAERRGNPRRRNGRGEGKVGSGSMTVERAVNSAASIKHFRARLAVQPVTQSSILERPVTRGMRQVESVAAARQFDTEECAGPCAITKAARRADANVSLCAGSSTGPRDGAIAGSGDETHAPSCLEQNSVSGSATNAVPHDSANVCVTTTLAQASHGERGNISQADLELQLESEQVASRTGAQLPVDCPVERGRSQATAEWVQSWQETWPKLREKGWHWDYGENMGASCVYLKPGISKEDATLGVDMFDSKEAVIEHILKRTASAATLPAASMDITRDDWDGTDSDGDIEVVKGKLSSTAWLTADASGQDGSQSAARVTNRAIEQEVQKKRDRALPATHSQGLVPSRPEKRGRVGEAEQPWGEPHGSTSQGQREEMGDYKDATGNSKGEIEVGASLVVDMLRGEMEESLARRCIESATRQLDAKGGTPDVDDLTAHCCEQLLALADGGGGASASEQYKEGNRICGRPACDGYVEDGVSGSSDSVFDGIHHIQNRKLSANSPANSPSVQNVMRAATKHPPRSRLVGPLAGVGVILAGLDCKSEMEIETKIYKLGGEVVDIFGNNANTERWRNWLVSKTRQTAPNRQACGESPPYLRSSGSSYDGGDSWSSKSREGLTLENIPRIGPPLRMIAVAAPGSEHTPPFHLAVAAGLTIVHPAYVDACSGMNNEVETRGYLLPLGRSAMGNQSLIMPFRLGRERPFAGKMVLLCPDPAADDALEQAVLTLNAAGATVKVLDGESGGGRCGAVAEANGVKRRRCTLRAALHLLQKGQVFCVVGPAFTVGSHSAAASIRSDVEKAAVEEGTLVGSLEWAQQCMVHGRLLLPSATACPWFPLSTPGVASSARSPPAGPGSDLIPVMEHDHKYGSGFHVHVSDGTRYITGDYVIVENENKSSNETPGAGPEIRAMEAAAVAAAATVAASNATDALTMVARVVSFRREAGRKVMVTLAMLGRGRGSNTLVAAGAEEHEVGEDRLGGRVLVLTEREMEVTQLYSFNDDGIFCIRG